MLFSVVDCDLARTRACSDVLWSIFVRLVSWKNINKHRVVPPVLFITNYYSIEILHGVTAIDEFQINEINVDLRTSGFDNEVLSVDACAVWWERESFYCLPRISVVTWHREPRFQCGSARTCSIWNSSIILTYHPHHAKLQVLPINKPITQTAVVRFGLSNYVCTLSLHDISFRRITGICGFNGSVHKTRYVFWFKT